MDKLTKEQRHRCMSAIKSKNTKPELLVRKFGKIGVCCYSSLAERSAENHENAVYYEY